MLIAARRGNRVHAPENTRTALISAWVAGADVLELDVRLTADHVPVVVHDPVFPGHAVVVESSTWANLRELDCSATFAPRGSPGFRYARAARGVRLERLDRLLDVLPRPAWKLIELKAAAPESRPALVEAVVEAVLDRGARKAVVLYSRDPECVRLVAERAPEVRRALHLDGDPERALQTAEALDVDGVVAGMGAVFAPDGTLTPFGAGLDALHAGGRLRLGAVLYGEREPSIFTRDEHQRASAHAFVWAVATDSVLEVRPLFDPATRWIDEPFAGTGLNRDRWSLGYAKANPYALVSVDDGVHIDIRPYDGNFADDAPDPILARMQRLEMATHNALKDWAFYSGGGVGLRTGIEGDFVAQVDYEVRVVTQATTFEMAVVNVDPGAHQERRPTTSRDKDSFYDPHGAPPFVGVEHDEDDGLRINWNLGTEYDNNQYGAPVGDGRLTCGTLRLERRGAWFAAYYRNGQDATDWVCVGTTRNESMNPVVHLRCVAKRWRQERSDDPSRFHPVVANHYVFRNLRIDRFFDREDPRD